eukprot:jgi/Tetstr1/447297/TSEL_034734.t1
MIAYVISAILQAVLHRGASPESPAIHCKRTASNLEILRNMPSLREFAPVARGAAFHTVFSRLRPSDPGVYDRRDTFPDTAIVLDWAFAPDPKGIVVLFHGLGGSSRGKTMRRICREMKDRGYTAVVYNRRGHVRGTRLPLHSEFPKHADVADARWAVDRVRQSRDDAGAEIPIYCVGVSAGANAMVRYLGEVPDHPVKAAVSICSPLDLVIAHRQLEKNSALDRHIASWLSKIYKRHFRMPYPVKSMREFDEMATGLPLEEYYARQSSVDALKGIEVPILCAGTVNDPIVHRCIIDLHNDIATTINPNVISVSTREGGHTGWIDAGGGWIEKVVAEFIEAC